MTHPLTEEMCEILSIQPWLYPEVDVEATILDMRAAADWQLEQVIEWLKDELDYRSDIDPNLLSDLKKAMRSQEDKQ